MVKKDYKRKTTKDSGNFRTNHGALSKANKNEKVIQNLNSSIIWSYLQSFS